MIFSRKRGSGRHAAPKRERDDFDDVVDGDDDATADEDFAPKEDFAPDEEYGEAGGGDEEEAAPNLKKRSHSSLY